MGIKDFIINIMLSLSEKELKNIEKLSSEDKNFLSKILSSKKISYKNAKKELKKNKKDYSKININEVDYKLLYKKESEIDNIFQ